MTNIDIYGLLEHWSLGPIRSVHSQTPGEYAAGNVSFIETEDGARYALKRKTVRRTLEQEYALLETLAAQGVPVAVPVRTRSGETCVQVGDERFTLSPHLPGAVYSDHYAPGAVDRARQFGVAIARLHAALLRCDSLVMAEEMDLPGDIARCSPAVAAIWPDNRPSFESIRSELETGLADTFPGLPKQLIHRDAHPGNMLFHDGQRRYTSPFTGWLDFEIMLRGPRLFDLGYCSTSLLVSGLDDPAKRSTWFSLLSALVAGYETVSPLTTVERQSLRCILLSIEVIFIAFFTQIKHSAGVALNIEGLAWLYENLGVYEPNQPV